MIEGCPDASDDGMPGADHHKCYVGVAESRLRRVWAETGVAQEALHSRLDGPNPFAWGRPGLPARELAWSILEDATGSALLAERLCREFTWDVVARFPDGGSG